MVLAIHVVFTLLPYMIGGWLWVRWGQRGRQPLLIEVTLFHFASIAASLWLLARFLGH